MSNEEQRDALLARIKSGEIKIEWPRPVPKLPGLELVYLSTAIQSASAMFMGEGNVSAAALMPGANNKPERLEVHQLVQFDEKNVEAVNEWFQDMVKERGFIVFCAEMWAVKQMNTRTGVETTRNREGIGVRLMTPGYQLLYVNPVAYKDGKRILTKWELSVDTRITSCGFAKVTVRDAFNPEEKN